MSKPTKAELENRVAKVAELLVRGAPRVLICQYVSDKTDWNVTDRTVDRYIAKATEAIKEGALNDVEFETGKAKERLEFLYQKNLVVSDYKAALAVVKARSELLGLEAPKKLKVIDTIEVTIKKNES